MSWMDMLTVTVAALSALECVAGRLAAMHPSEHRGAVLAGYFAAFSICVAAGLLIWLGADARWLDAAVWAVALHLVATLGDWRDGPPLTAYKPRPVRYRPGDMVPSSQFDDGRR